MTNLKIKQTLLLVSFGALLSTVGCVFPDHRGGGGYRDQGEYRGHEEYRGRPEAIVLPDPVVDIRVHPER